MKYISPLELKKEIEQEIAVIVDIREPYECAICSIQAIQIPMGEVVYRKSELPNNIQLYVMCKTGKRSEAVANMLLTDFGMPNVGILEGGIMAWIAQVDQTLEAY